MDINKLKTQKTNPYVSNNFKLWLVPLIFFLTFFHLYDSVIYPQVKIVSSEIILGVVLVLVLYLWVQELKDRHRLQRLNQALIEAHGQLQEAEINAIGALILTEEAKDPYVKGHSKRVAQISLAIAKEMGLSEQTQAIIERAGILHDIGKLGIEDEVLKKPGKLNDQEWQIMKKHPLRSVEILEPLKFLAREKDIIMHHHERCDGKGYPSGLKCEEIPFEARIIAVADTFDAMNSERAYRKPLPKDVILSELNKASGSQLDPSVVTAFLKLLEKSPSLWERE
jgi:putative nucleotidyltransferase with HDIG domain